MRAVSPPAQLQQLPPAQLQQLHAASPSRPAPRVDSSLCRGAADKRQNRETLRAKLEGQSEFRRESQGRSRRWASDRRRSKRSGQNHPLFDQGNPRPLPNVLARTHTLRWLPREEPDKITASLLRWLSRSRKPLLPVRCASPTRSARSSLALRAHLIISEKSRHSLLSLLLDDRSRLRSMASRSCGLAPGLDMALRTWVAPVASRNKKAK